MPAGLNEVSREADQILKVDPGMVDGEGPSSSTNTPGAERLVVLYEDADAGSERRLQLSVTTPTGGLSTDFEDTLEEPERLAALERAGYQRRTLSVADGRRAELLTHDATREVVLRIWDDLGTVYLRGEGIDAEALVAMVDSMEVTG